MSRANFTRAAFRSILAGSRPMVAFGADEPVPHEDDWVHGGGDTRDYGAWIDRRVDETARDFGRALETLVGPTGQNPDFTPDGTPVTPRAIAYFELRGKWLEWEYDWKQFLAEIEDSWWTRQLAWEQLEGKHAELLEHRRRLAETGIVKLRQISTVPKPKDPAKDAADVLTAGAFVLLGVAAIMAVREFKR